MSTCPNIKDEEMARVRFFPNGTCDEMTIVLHSPDNGEWHKIALEVTTSLATVGPVDSDEDARVQDRRAGPSR